MTSESGPAAAWGEDLGEIGLAELERRVRGGDGEERLALRAWLALAEAWWIIQALRRARGNRSAAAQALGIGRRTLYSKMERLGLTGAWSVWRSSRCPDPERRPACD